MSATWGAFSSLINVNELNEYVRHKGQEMMGYAQLCNPPTGGALGRKRGDTVQYTFYPNISSAGGELTETERVPRRTITPIKATYTIKEYGNSLDWTESVEELSRLDSESDFIKALVDDYRKLDNSLAFDEFEATEWFFVPNTSADEFDTDNSPSSTANDTFDHAKLRAMVKRAEKNLIPKFDGENYVFASGVDSIDAIAYDTVVSGALSNAGAGRSALNGEVGVLAGCRLVKDSHKATFIGGSAAATLALDKGHLVGADAVIHEVAAPVELRAEDDDFGRFVAVAYLWRGCFKKILSQDTHSQEHVIKVASA